MAISDILKKLFGSKADRDMKEVKPVLDQVLAAYENIDKLSNDALRARSEELKAKLRACEAPFENRIAEIRAELEKDIPVSRKEQLATESDKLVKDEDEAIEKVLDEILPDAFAIMKSTARRFAEKEFIEVTASEFDRTLAASGKDFVSIEQRNGTDVAVWRNHWMAGGNEITWDMVHYDVQLIGGIVLHKGKIAEMATGEGKTLVATLPVFLNALAGKGVHMVTVNDYLSKRDSEWMGPLYMFHGLSVDCIDKHQPHSDETTWPSARPIWCSANTISPSWTRWTPCSSTMPEPRSSSPVPLKNRPLTSSTWSSVPMWRNSTVCSASW